MYERPSWDQYFMNIVNEVAKRATCDRGRSGALIVKNRRIVTAGYVGAPHGTPHCDEVGHLIKKSIKANGDHTENCIRTTHAEMNAIIQAALHGVSTIDSTIYCKMEPCLDCAKAIINAGIKRVVCEKKYKDAETTRDFFKKAGIELVVLNDSIEEY